MLGPPVNLPKWCVPRLSKPKKSHHSTHMPRLEENSHLLKPPINNYCVWNDDFAVMVRPT